ncbi:acetate kinase [Maribacter vaceletii]|uniref:Acetate kinase n=1 Tax=Maribacter vaceletii TaxID=1206816 RepID=A0A495DTT5_9FLAO|nr:acetate kinase [Maribacter vaceletii]RKR08046.1 acetate kinase [Maribacter vaceletii]
MNILVINSGSSSIKFQLIQMPSEKVLCKGLLERIGLEDSIFSYNKGSYSNKEKTQIPNHSDGLDKISQFLLDPSQELISSVSDINMVGHRVVHGGSKFNAPTKVTLEVLKEIEALSFLAPLHNPANAEGIRVAMNVFKDAEQIAVFDTAFFQTLPEIAYTYAIPKDIALKHKIRAYGFHGTSHKYVSEKVNSILKKKQSKIITIHLGNGCSITAIKNGKSIDHSLGFSPTNGLVMGTRCGDIDQSIIFYMMESLNITGQEVSNILQKESGLLGLTGHSDLREIEEKAKAGNRDCILALQLSAYRIKKYIGSYITVLSGLDAIVFTAGIGENSSTLRKLICEGLECFNIQLDTEKNNLKIDGIRDIGSSHSRARILVVPTNEELEIAKQSYSLSNNMPK